ncbi:MAG TPA: hypothetical protein VGD60_01955, partial [Candidatus Acidoferrales bacterium]
MALKRNYLRNNTMAKNILSFLNYGSQKAIPGGIVLSVALIVSGCSVGPKYQKPTADVPQAYKELTPADFSKTDGWKVAQPKDAALHGKWWEVFNDLQLNAIEEQVNISNQNIKSSTASYFAARALVKEARAAYYPTVTVGPS